MAARYLYSISDRNSPLLNVLDPQAPKPDEVRNGGGKYAAGDIYVMGRFDLDKNVVQTASAIAADISHRIKNQSGPVK